MKQFIQWCRRYVSLMSIVVIVFVAYTMFIQENSVFRYMRYNNTIDSLQTQIRNYTDTMQYYHHMNSLLSRDPDVMERVVREQYNMNREGEDVYVFD